MDSRSSTPRWGNRNRDSKAASILATVRASMPDGCADQTWIDIGCGSGGITGFLARHVPTVIGLDPEPWPGWRKLEETYPNLVLRQAPCDIPTPPAAPE